MLGGIPDIRLQPDWIWPDILLKPDTELYISSELPYTKFDIWPDTGYKERSDIRFIHTYNNNNCIIIQVLKFGDNSVRIENEGSSSSSRADDHNDRKETITKKTSIKSGFDP